VRSPVGDSGVPGCLATSSNDLRISETSSVNEASWLTLSTSDGSGSTGPVRIGVTVTGTAVGVA
jgi:hypothetical protein